MPLSFLLYYTMDVYCVSNLSLSSMAYRVSLKSAPPTRFVLLLTILFSPLCIWTRYKFFDHSDIQHLEILSYAKSNGNDQVLWAKFLNILAVAQSDGSTLKVDQVSGRFTEIQHVDILHKALMPRIYQKLASRYQEQRMLWSSPCFQAA